MQQYENPNPGGTNTGGSGTTGSGGGGSTNTGGSSGGSSGISFNPSSHKQDNLGQSPNTGIPPDPEAKLPKDGPRTEELIKERKYFGESESADLGKYFTIEVGALEGQMPEFSIDEVGNINVSIIVTNVARVSFDVHNASQSSGLRIDIDCGKGVFELTINKTAGLEFRVEADAVRVTGTTYCTIGNKRFSLATHAEAGAELRLVPVDLDLRLPN